MPRRTDFGNCLNYRNMTEKKELKVFTFNENNQPIRVKVFNDNLWFVAKDVAKALNISWSSATLAQIPEEWKGMMNFITPGGEQQLTVISEAGMYKLAFRCQSSERADKFTNWVAGEVLPTLRKTGKYELNPQKHSVVRRTRGEGVNVELTNLLWLIGESLMQGDQSAVALELGVSRMAVNRTLNGYNRSSRILMALYQKARQNRERNLLYYAPGVMAERLLGHEAALPMGNPLPTVQFGGKRGGKIGNQNARKHWGKEGK